jgi:hypothetical protein
MIRRHREERCDEAIQGPRVGAGLFRNDTAHDSSSATAGLAGVPWDTGSSKAPPPLLFGRRGVRRLFSCPLETRGAERREGARVLARHPLACLAIGPPGRFEASASLAKRDARLSALHLRHLQMRVAPHHQFRAALPGVSFSVAPFGVPRRSAVAAGSRKTRLPVQQAPCRAVVMPPGRSPGTARVPGLARARPAGPHRPACRGGS